MDDSEAGSPQDRCTRDGAAAAELARSKADLAAALDALHRSECLRSDAAKRAAALENELQHRVRNMLATLRSVFTRTIDAAGTLEEAADHFTGRLDTMARYQGVMARYPHGTVDFEMLIRDELLTLGFGSSDRVTVQGASVKLPLEVAGPIGLAVHELVTNSMKFGALSDNGGQLTVLWSTEGPDGALTFEWTETGVPVVASAPLRVGFGREYIESALPYQLDADTHFELRPGGGVCRIILAKKWLEP